MPEYSNIQDDYYDEFDDIYIDGKHFTDLLNKIFAHEIHLFCLSQKDSIVVEDPGLQNDEQTTKIDLNKYLVIIQFYK